jgi:hypothetical protein
LAGTPVTASKLAAAVFGFVTAADQRVQSLTQTSDGAFTMVAGGARPRGIPTNALSVAGSPTAPA